MKLRSVRLSVCLSVPSFGRRMYAAAAAGLLLWAWRPGDIDLSVGC